MIPTIWMGFALQDPNTPFATFAIIALLCGFGGANFASSMSNISFFYPKSQQGTAMGLNAGLGNLGVSVMQFLVPAVIGVGIFGALGGDAQTTAKGTTMYLQNAGFVWVPLIIIAALAAWFGMNDLSSAKASFKDQS
ncbi:nitrate/nitrite transporter, partial [Xanthomonas citri pv. citri]